MVMVVRLLDDDLSMMVMVVVASVAVFDDDPSMMMVVMSLRQAFLLAILLKSRGIVRCEKLTRVADWP